MNHVALTGSAATDANVGQLPNGVPVATFVMAVERDDGECDFFRVRLYGRRATIARRELRTGRRVAIEGALREVTCLKGGEQRRSVVISAQRIEYLL